MEKECGCGDTPPVVGNPVVIWPGWGVNDARNNGADINPLPVQVLHYGNWTATQVQLKNGLELSNFGRREDYQDFRKLLYSSSSSTSKGPRQVLPGFKPSGAVQPSNVQLAQMISNGAPNQSGLGGTGEIAPGVDLSNRRFYG